MRVDRIRGSVALAAVFVLTLAGCETDDTEPIDEQPPVDEELPATAPER